VAGTRELVFDRGTEYRIYRTIPHTIGARVLHGASVPVGFLAGTASREMRHVGVDATRRLVGEHLEWVEGSHLFPMERPIETARAIQKSAAAAHASQSEALPALIGRLDLLGSGETLRWLSLQQRIPAQRDGHALATA